MLKNLLLAAILTAPAGSTALAAGDQPTDSLRARLNELVPDRQPDRIEPTPVPGLFEVVYGAQVFYFTPDGRYLLRGELVDLEQGVNLTQRAGDKYRAGVLAQVDKEDMIVFAPEKPRHTVTVFTDIDCPYCRKMHAEIEAYKAKDIAVRYMMFPRAGVGSPSYDTAVSVWCAEDSRQALTRAKQGEDIEPRSCENPVAEQFKLGQEIGVQGTPAIVLEDGEMITGYRSPEDLALLLDDLASDQPASSTE